MLSWKFPLTIIVVKWFSFTNWKKIRAWYEIIEEKYKITNESI